METDLKDLRKLLQSCNKKNKILNNVILLIIDSFPDNKTEIANLISEEANKNNNPFISDFIEALSKHNSEFKQLIVKQENIENELPLPPEMIFFNLVKHDSIFIENIKKIGPKIELKIEKLMKNQIYEKNETQKRKVQETDQPKPKRTAAQPKNEEKELKKEETLFDILFTPLQCRICATRFHSDSFSATDSTVNQDYIDHMEQHAKKTQKHEDERFRPFFDDEDGWMTEKSQKINFDLPALQPECPSTNPKSPTKTVKLLVKKKLVHCALCKNKMNVVWDDDDDSWAIKNGVKLGDEYVHKECAF